jgi:putative oxidoreductase
MSIDQLVVLLVRCGLVMLFLPFSALDKVFNFSGAVGQASETFSFRPLAVAAIAAGLGIEIFMSLGIVLGIADRLCAFVMAGYCAMTALLWKRFWAQGDFWSGPASRGRGLFWDFLKNLSLGAGFLLITIGPTGAGLNHLLHSPFESTYPYG